MIKCEGSLRGSKIRRVQSDVRRDDADERNRRKVESLGNHLRADQHVAVSGELIEQARVVADARRRIAIHANNARVRIQPRDFLRHALRSDAELSNGVRCRSTFADRGQRALRIAVVAAKQSFAAMNRE